MNTDNAIPLICLLCLVMVAAVSIFRDRYIENERRLTKIGVWLILGAIGVVLTAVWIWALNDLDEKIGTAMGTTAGFMAAVGAVICIVIEERTVSTETTVMEVNDHEDEEKDKEDV